MRTRQRDGMRALSCWVNAEDRLRNVLLMERYTWVPGPGAPASRPEQCVFVSAPRMRAHGRENNFIPWGGIRACSMLRFGF